MVLLEKPQPEMQHQPGEWEVYRVMSQSEPGVFHIVAVQYEQTMHCDEDDCTYSGTPVAVDGLCSCKGFNYQKGCWHLESLGYGE